MSIQFFRVYLRLNVNKARGAWQNLAERGRLTELPILSQKCFSLTHTSLSAKYHEAVNKF